MSTAADPEVAQREIAFDFALRLSAVVAADPDFSPIEGYSAYTFENAKRIEHYLKTGGNQNAAKRTD